MYHPLALYIRKSINILLSYFAPTRARLLIRIFEALTPRIVDTLQVTDAVRAIAENEMYAYRKLMERLEMLDNISQELSGLMFGTKDRDTMPLFRYGSLVVERKHP